MKKTFFLLAILAVATLSCIRQEFNLNNDLDTNIRFGGEVMYIPIGTTDSLLLSDFLDADDIDILGTFNEGYAIIVENVSNIELNEISDLTFAMEPFNVEIDSGFYLPPSAIDIINLLLQAEFDGSISLEDLNTEATRPGSPLNQELINSGDIGQFPLPLFAILDTLIDISISEPLDNEHITNVDTLWLSANSGFDVMINPLNAPDGIELRLDVLRLEFPPSVHLDTRSEFVTSAHVFEKVNIYIDTDTFRIPILYLTDIHGNQAIELSDAIGVYARYSLDGSFSGGFFPHRADSSTRLDLNVVPNLDFRTATVTVNFDDEISVDLSGLPEILLNNRDSLILDVRPHLSLHINTTLQIPNATVYLRAYRNGHPETTLDIPINISAAVDNRLWISYDDALMPSNQGYRFVSRDLGAMVREIPDSIVVRIAESQVVFDINQNYYVRMNYNFVVPLAFGERFSIVIQDTFHLDAAIGEMISGNSIGLSVRALNNIPLDLIGQATPIDAEGHALDIEIPEFTIRANSTMDSLPASLDFNDRDTDLLQYMRGLVFRFEVRPGANTTGQALRHDNFIQVRLNARIEGGVTVDLNNL